MSICHTLLRQSGQVSGNELIHFLSNTVGKIVSVSEHFGFQTAFRNKLSSRTKVLLYSIWEDWGYMIKKCVHIYIPDWDPSWRGDSWDKISHHALFHKCKYRGEDPRFRSSIPLSVLLPCAGESGSTFPAYLLTISLVIYLYTRLCANGVRGAMIWDHHRCSSMMYHLTMLVQSSSWEVVPQRMSHISSPLMLLISI